ncbi:YgiQ family radical SAM protein [Caloranaerobacter azorensis]|nr:YgiQ family radical SAM protein [Caloranaerobacter azorensis]
MKEFLPITKEDMRKRGWTELDFILITGDAYVDHSSFGSAIISRLLERYGYKVGIIAQPSWKSTDDFKKLGKPRLAFLITSGNLDSMVNHYTVAKKRRKKDVYSPGGKIGLRPDRATIVYANKAREAYKDVPIILGGIEASLRRLAHYDYWSDKVRRSILLDAKADLLIYGMGERQIVEIAEALDSGIPVNEITYIRGTVYKTKDLSRPYKPIILPSFEEIIKSRLKFAESFKIQYQNMDYINGRTLVEPYGNIYIVQNPPAKPLDQLELDDIYDLPYTRTYHPVYEKYGGVPAIEEIKFSLTSSRGCFGNCNFCALAFHQGRVVQARSHESIVKEAERFVKEPDFKGYIHDVGGPTANFRHRACEKQIKHGVCKNKECLFPKPCKNLYIDHRDYLELLRKLRKIKGVKKVFIRSGIRYDYLVYDRDLEFFHELCKYHISGQLRVAPEHISSHVLFMMGKPDKKVYFRFVDTFKKINKKIGKEQFIVPYFISSHPGSTLKDAVELAEYLNTLGYMPEQVQDFYPTPGTLSTCMYYTGIDPRTMKKVYVAKSPHEKAMQRALMQFKKPENYDLVYEALKRTNRLDLVGYSKKCLIKPRGKDTLKSSKYKSKKQSKKTRKKRKR